MSLAESTATKPRAAKSGSLKEKAYQILRRKILTGEFKGGVQVVEADLITHLQIGRTPIRESILRLEQEGLVRIVPHKGIFVNEMSLKEIKDLIQLRFCLELYAIREAISYITDNDIKEMSQIIDLQEQAMQDCDTYKYMNLDRRFHQKIFEIIGNDRMLRIMGNLNDQLVACGIRGLRKQERLVQVITEHREVVQALSKRDADAAFEAVKLHLERVRGSLTDL